MLAIDLACYLRVQPRVVRQQTEEAITMMKVFKNFLADESAATAIEYGLIAALIAVAAVTVMGTVGTNLSSTFNTIATKL